MDQVLLEPIQHNQEQQKKLNVEHLISDPYKAQGKIVLKIEKFSEFAAEKHGNRRVSEPDFIYGLPWNIRAVVHESGDETNEAFPQKWLGIFLGFDKKNIGAEISCTVSVYFKIVSQKEGKEDYVGQKGSCVFNAFESGWGSPKFMEFQTIMNPENGWYNAEADTVILSADVTADVPLGVRFMQNEDTLCVNGMELNINKHFLAAHSEFFRKLFFTYNGGESDKVQIDPPATIACFRLILDILSGTMNEKQIIDENVEGVLYLADQFQFNTIRALCSEYLLSGKCKRPAIFKYRLAAKYNLPATKELLLKKMTKNDFNVAGCDYMDVLHEYGKMDAEDAEQFRARYRQLFPPSPQS